MDNLIGRFIMNEVFILNLSFEDIEFGPIETIEVHDSIFSVTESIEAHKDKSDEYSRLLAFNFKSHEVRTLRKSVI